MKYVISSSVFTSKKKALEQIAEWARNGTLDDRAKIYEVKKSYRPEVIMSWEVVLNEERR